MHAARSSLKADSRSRRDSLRIFGSAFFLTLIGFVIAYQFVDPAPPDRIVIGTGEGSGGYHAFARRYATILVKEGITLEVRPTRGSLENLQLLQDESQPIDLAFVQGGIGASAAPAGLLSLSSLYYEPLWVFHRAGLTIEFLSDLASKRIAVGPEGSGTRAVAVMLLEGNGITPANAEFLDHSGKEAIGALRKGKLDALFLVASPASTLVGELLAAEDIALMDFARAEAYTRVHPFLSRVVLPQGVIDFQRDIPSKDIHLVSPTANLVAHPDLHPALIDLLLQTVDEVHGSGGIFERPGEFPSARFVEFPLSSDAKRYLKSGPPFLQRYLPFWAATMIDRLKVMLVPLVMLLLPLFRIAPPLYRWRIRSRIYRWYRELLDIEGQSETGEQIAAAMARLDRIETEVCKVSVPTSYGGEFYNLRLHIDQVKQRLQGGSSTNTSLERES